MSKKTTFVVYDNGKNAFITIEKQEAAMLEEWFAPGIGRKVKDYDRRVTKDTGVFVSSDLSVF